MSSDDIYANQAKDLVDNVISMAIKRLETNASLMSDKEKTFESLKFSEMSRESTIAREDNYVVENISWLCIGEFTVEKAENKIDDFIQVCTTCAAVQENGINRVSNQARHKLSLYTVIRLRKHSRQTRRCAATKEG